MSPRDNLVPVIRSGANDKSDLMLPILLADQQSLADQDPLRPFGSAHPILSAVSQLLFQRLPGRVMIDETEVSATVPCGLIGATHSLGTPVALMLASNGCEIAVRIGGLPGAGEHLGMSFSQSLRVELGSSSAISTDQLGRFHYSCLTLAPSFEPATSRTQRPHSGIDRALLALSGTPFIFIVYATPESAVNIQNALNFLSETAQRLDRTSLKIGQQQQVNRYNQHAASYMDRQLSRLRYGLQDGLWRTSVLVGAANPDAAEYAAAVIAGNCEHRRTEELVIKTHRCLNDVGYPMANVNCLTSEELSALWMIPTTDSPGFFVRRSARFDMDVPELSSGIQIGWVKSGETTTQKTLSVSTESLTHHALVCGHTGSGKSSTIRYILKQLYALKIPFLVIEPAKSEYAALAADIDNLTVLRAGKIPTRDEVPFQLNPFAFPDGVQLSTHIDSLKQCFIASFGLVPPTPYLLESAIYKAYERRGWDLNLGTHRNGGDRLSFPTLSDLLDEIDVVVDAARYDTEVTRNLKGALKTRIGNLCQGAKGIALDTRDEVSQESLFGSPAVLELRHLGSDQEKALVMGLILTRLYEIREIRGVLSERDNLTHLLVIEEAHRLLRQTAPQSAEFGNMAHQAVESFANQIAEVRAYGQGVMVAEQIPTKLTSEVVKQSGLKIVHRLLPAEDRKLIGDAMVLNRQQSDKLALLEVGEAAVHGEGMDGAVLLQIPTPETSTRSLASSRTPNAAASVLLRLATKKYLDHKTVREAADTFVLGVVADPGPTFTSSNLRRCIAELSERWSDGLDLAQQRGIERLAIDHALERRALYNVLPQAMLAKWMDLAARASQTLGADIRRVLSRKTGPIGWCHGCKAPCLYAYEGSQLAGDERYQQQLDRIIDTPYDDWPRSIQEAACEACYRLYGQTQARAVISYCATGRILSGWGMSEACLSSLLNEIPWNNCNTFGTAGSESVSEYDQKRSSSKVCRDASGEETVC